MPHAARPLWPWLIFDVRRNYPVSAEEEDSESAVEEKTYSFIPRFILFVFIAGPASVFALGIYGRMGLRDAIAAMERGSYSPIAILILWLVGLVGTAVMIFKR